jgi:hypothetical protein
MHRCGFLRLRFIHRQKLPTSRNATRNSRSTPHHSVGPGGTRIPPGIAFLASVTSHPATASFDRGANVPFSRSRPKPEPSISREWSLSWCDHGDYSQRLPRVPISSVQGDVFVDRDHNEPGLLLKNEISRRTRQSTTSRRRWISLSLGLSRLYQPRQSTSRKKAGDRSFSDFCRRPVLPPHQHEGHRSYILNACQAKNVSGWPPTVSGGST